MAQSIAFGAYTIHIDGGKLTVLDHNDQLVATADLTADAAAKISLPNGQVLDMGQLADALSSDHIADFATAAGGSGAAGGASGSGMFFHNAHDQGLGGFDEMQVIKSSLETPATAPSTEDQQATFSPETFIALQRTPAGETTPPPSSGQLPVDNTPSHNLPDDNPPSDNHASDNAGGSNNQGNNSQGGSHASDNSGGGNDQGNNSQGGSHASDNSGSNNDQGDNSQGGSHASDNSGGGNDQGDNSQGGSHASDNSGSNN
ncbi:MAG TPA: hypothetical protein VN229_04230, partial [Terriglobales bacterium]|nr:hypothetical protein [Terriglobales bacterium]